MDSNHLPRFLVTSFLFIDTEANICNKYNQIKHKGRLNKLERNSTKNWQNRYISLRFFYEKRQPKNH